jgi:enoyl-CoA hydratase/carnithine racemase
MLIITQKEDVLWVRLNRPAAANALNLDMYEQLHTILRDAADRPEVKVVVLAGEGMRAFCAGADLKEFTELGPIGAEKKQLELLLRCLLDLLEFPKPLLAMLQAPAVGAGLMLAAVCDEVVMADHTWVSLPEVKFDLPTPVGAAVVSARVSRQLQYRLVQLGQRCAAQECLSSGLVDHLAESDALESFCEGRAQALAQIPARAFSVNKQWMNQTLRKSLLEAGHEAHTADLLIKNLQ